jgi:hypothetical protein
MHGDCLYGQYLDLCKQSRRPSETYKNGTPMIMGTQSFLETKEMQIQQDNDRIPQTYHSERKTVNGSGKAQWN